jgi:4-hydroxybenzoate polyprenyltransferase
MKWLHFILSHSIFISICAVALAFQTTQLLRLNNNLFVYGFIFFATICSYNFYWILSKISFNKKSSVTGVLKNETTEIYLLIISAIGVAFCFLMSAIPFTFVMTAILLTGIYSLPLLPFSFLQFTRRAGVLKTIILAITWAYVTAFLPLQKTYLQLDHADLFIITRRFLFMLMLCIIFDSRDIAVDKLRGLKSLATELRPATLRFLVYIIFIVLFATNFLFIYYGITFYQSLALQVSTLALLAVYFFSTKKQGYLFYYFVVDGMMLFSALATYIASI